ncbi:MAG: hypothetical protein M0P71_06335 [Melioribacteraceae bacterium]|nr:hypothetical protein [Melioribacteraceae bacterium]
MYHQKKLAAQMEGMLDTLNQIFEIERKLAKIPESNSISRNLNKLKYIFENQLLGEENGLVYHNPINEKFDETRIDCEATIAGESTENLIITEVIKPIIRLKTSDGLNQIIQKAIVVVQSQNKFNEGEN